jgi:NAD(P)-dependent dehydrogenase (short-subunit alcohol dehydrogenase family)
MTGQVAVVTGGSQGIGAAAALALGLCGASVALTYNLSKAGAMEIVKQIEEAGSQAIAIPLDLQDTASIQNMVLKTMERFGRIDILVNNAAVGSASVTHYSGTDKLDQAMVSINTLGILLCAQAVLPVMIDQNYGKIINVSSVGGGITVFPKFKASDGMSKCAVAFLSRQIVADHPHHAIDAFSICPGAVNTRMFRESTLDHLSPVERIPLFRHCPWGG